MSSGSTVWFYLFVLSPGKRGFRLKKENQIKHWENPKRIGVCAGISASLRDHLRRTRPGVVFFVCLCMCAIWFTNCVNYWYTSTPPKTYGSRVGKKHWLRFSRRRSPFKKTRTKNTQLWNFLSQTRPSTPTLVSGTNVVTIFFHMAKFNYVPTKQEINSPLH